MRQPFVLSLLIALQFLLLTTPVFGQVVPSGYNKQISLGGEDVYLFSQSSQPTMSLTLSESTSFVWILDSDTIRTTTGTTDTLIVENPGLYTLKAGSNTYTMRWLSPIIESAQIVVDSATCEAVYVSSSMIYEPIVLNSVTAQQSFSYDWIFADTLEHQTKRPYTQFDEIYEQGILQLQITNLAGNTFVVSDTIVPVAVKAALSYESRKENADNEAVVSGEAISSPAEIVFTNKSEGAFTVSEWQIGNLTRLYDRDPIYQFQQPGTYTVSLVVTNELSGCQSIDSTTQITVSEAALGFPNAFTPNGDGVNDVFKPAFRSLKSFELTIFNRWGRKVFSTSSPTDGWDGTINGRDAAAGTYYYYATAEGYEKDVSFIRHGSVSLIR